MALASYVYVKKKVFWYFNNGIAKLIKNEDMNDYAERHK